MIATNYTKSLIGVASPLDNRLTYKLPLHLKHIFDFAQPTGLSEVVGVALPLAITNSGCTLNVEQPKRVFVVVASIEILLLTAN
jgi:hypothetical protein